jgi:hypothetical protein
LPNSFMQCSSPQKEMSKRGLMMTISAMELPEVAKDHSVSLAAK